MVRTSKKSKWRQQLNDMPETEKIRLLKFASDYLHKLDNGDVPPAVKISKTTTRQVIIKPSVKEIVTLDGVKMELEAADFDGDGQTGGIEKVQQSFDQGIQPVVQPSELGDTLKELNKDDLEEVSRMSGIDMRARLKQFEVASVLALDALVSLGVLPTKCLAFTRQKKRLSVSIDGLGRKEIVELVGGKRELDAKAGFGGMMDKGKNFMGMNR